MRRFEFVMKILIGLLLLALSVNVFVLPFGFISGGTTGLGIIGRYFWHWNFNMVVTAANVIMFIVGFIVMGKKFAATTLLATFIYPVLLEVTSRFTDKIHLTNDPLVACVMYFSWCRDWLGHSKWGKYGWHGYPAHCSQ